MSLVGSILLIAGIAGVVAMLGLLTLRPRLLPRSMVVFAFVVLFIVAGVGLVMMTASSGGNSLHTGG
jgi:hypothetical protein